MPIPTRSPRRLLPATHSAPVMWAHAGIFAPTQLRADGPEIHKYCSHDAEWSNPRRREPRRACWARRRRNPARSPPSQPAGLCEGHRSGPGDGRGRRRSVGDRHVRPSRRPVPFLDAVGDAGVGAAHDRHAAHLRPHRAGHWAKPGRARCAALRHDRAPRRGRHAGGALRGRRGQRGGRPRRRGTRHAPVAPRAAHAVGARGRRRRDPAAGAGQLSARGAPVQRAGAGPADLRCGAGHCATALDRGGDAPAAAPLASQQKLRAHDRRPPGHHDLALSVHVAKRPPHRGAACGARRRRPGAAAAALPRPVRRFKKRVERLDITLGMLLSQLVAFAIIVVTASTVGAPRRTAHPGRRPGGERAAAAGRAVRRGAVRPRLHRLGHARRARAGGRRRTGHRRPHG